MNRRVVGPDARSLWVGFLSWDSQAWGDFRLRHKLVWVWVCELEETIDMEFIWVIIV